ncbi:hypothetical protein IG631_10917 [Alternaria alternata]|nr:hypothetical protein IG631_10917 [Alternaria alternata]
MATTTTAHPAPAMSSTDSDRIDKEPRLTHTSTNISLSPELFEKLYLAPKTPNANDHVGRYANATPLGFLGGIFFFTGPVLLTLATIFLWIQAQFFPMMVCGLFSVFWLSFGMLQLPTLGLAAAYSSDGDAAAGAVSKEMNAVIALYLLVWGFALGTFWLFTIRINVVFAGIFGFVTIGAWVLSGAYWALSNGEFDKALRLQKAGGALLFIVGLLGWYMLFVIMAAEMRWSVCPPVGDLSRYWAKTDVEIGANAGEKKD